ncbi:MAG: class I SAM-dependent methyltransferase [Rhodospirillaceae bacterium]
MLPTESKSLPDSYKDPDYLKMSDNFDDSSSYFTESNPVFRMIHESSHKKVAFWEDKHQSKAGNASNWTIDIGTGQGYHWPFVKDNSRFVGLDIRMESLEKIKQIFPDALLVQGNILSIPFKANAFTRAVSIYALEHIYFLNEGLKEIHRILAPEAAFHVGIPCEGGLGWTLGRKLTSERSMSKRYNIDYRKYIALEHCNTALKINKALKLHFKLEKTSHFPFPFLPSIDLNLTRTMQLRKSK